MQHRFSKYLRFLTFLGDIISINALFIIFYLKGEFIIHANDQSWPLFLLIINVSWLIIIFYTSTYKISRVYPLSKLTKTSFYAVFQHFLVTLTTIYLFDFRLTYKWAPILVYASFLLIVLIWRLALYYFLSFYRSKGYNFRNVAIIGYGTIAKHLEAFFKLHPEYGYHLIGYFDDHVNNSKIKGDVNSLKLAMQNNEYHIDEVYFCLPYVRYGQIKQIIDICEDKMIKVKMITDFRAFSFKGLELERYDHIPVLNVSAVPLDERKNQRIKRAFDIVFSSLVFLFVLSWLIPIIGILIKLDSHGPVFFKQKRAGKGNRPFDCLKFRTMVVHDSEFKQAEKNDPRVTRIGKFLRKTSLDEIPQFINVLMGDMSIIGPRPHPIKLNEEFSPRIEKFMARHYVKPGITGLAQSKGYRGETSTIISMKNRVKLDRFYIDNWSFLLDLKIILATIITIVKGDEKAF